MSIEVSKVGHLVLRVADLDRALAFYAKLGLREVARRDFGEGPMAFLSTGKSHHDVALVGVGAAAMSPGNGLHHFAMKVGESKAALAEARHALQSQGIAVHMALDHHVSQGLYVSDPDGNLIELYVDAPEQIWRDDPTRVANSDPLEV